MPGWTRQPVASPRLVKLNVELARNLGLDPDALASEQGVAILAGNRGGRGLRASGASPMPGTSSGISSLSSATAAPTCWAR